MPSLYSSPIVNYSGVEFDFREESFMINGLKYCP